MDVDRLIAAYERLDRYMSADFVDRSASDDYALIRNEPILAIESLTSERAALLAHIAKQDAEIAGLRAFAKDVMEVWPEGGLDGGSLQGYAVKHGLLREVTMPAPCGPDCACCEYIWVDDFPTKCCRRTSLLTGKPESDTAIDALAQEGT